MCEARVSILAAEHNGIIAATVTFLFPHTLWARTRMPLTLCVHDILAALGASYLVYS